MVPEMHMNILVKCLLFLTGFKLKC